MSDIVERLQSQRDHADDWRTTLAEEAADEIERLRREQTDPTNPESKAWQFQEVMAVMHGDGGHYLVEHGAKKAADDAIAKHYALRADNERLRKLLGYDYWTAGAEIDALKLEIERLVGLLREAYGWLGPHDHRPADLIARIDAALGTQAPQPTVIKEMK